MIKLLLRLLLSATGLAYAEDIYIAQTAKGADSGTSAANAHAWTWFNSGSNWTALPGTDGRIGPGDTVHLTGVISNQLQIMGSGTPGNRITIKFDPGSVMEHPTWTGTGAIYGNGVHDITIEGKNSAPIKETLAAVDIRATQNGTERPLQVDGTRAIFIENAGGNITLRNLWITDLYVRTYQHRKDRHASGSAVSIRAQGPDVVIENCAVFHAETGLNISNLGSGLSERFIIRDSLVSDCSNGIKMGASGSGIVKDGKIIRNRIDHMARWGGIATNGFHADGIQTISQGSARIDNLHVAYNHIGPNVGLSGDLTALIFLEDFINGAKVYNNFLEYAAGHHSSNHTITAGTHPTIINQAYGERTVIANNTILRHGGAAAQSGGIGASGAFITGNVVYNMHSYISLQDNASFSVDGKNNYCDYNIFFGSSDNGPFGITGFGQGIYSIAKWKNDTSYDDHSLIQVDPKITKTTPIVHPRLQAGSPAIGLAKNQLTAIFNDDFNGNLRTGSWDAGAFEFDGAVSTPTPAPTPGPTPTPVPTPVPTPIPTPVPTPIPTPVPTQSPTPTPIPTPVPAETPSPTPPVEGMWNVSGTVIKTQSGFRLDLVIED